VTDSSCLTPFVILLYPARVLTAKLEKGFAVGGRLAPLNSVTSGRSEARLSPQRTLASVALMPGAFVLVTRAKRWPLGNGWREDPTARENKAVTPADFDAETPEYNGCVKIIIDPSA